MAEHHPPAGHGHHHAPDHVPHVTPLWIYLATWGALMVLTAITVGASYVNFGPGNLIIALLIATIKAAVVGAMFMHLLHDHKFHTLILVSGGLFLIIFISFTMFDTEYRGRADRVEGDRPADITRPFEMTEAQAKMKKHYDLGHAAVAASASGGTQALHEGPAMPSMSAAPDHSASAGGAAENGSAAPPARSDEPAHGAAPSGSVSVVTSAQASASVPPPPSAKIAPVPGAPQKPKPH